jgi:hypothetical protein
MKTLTKMTAAAGALVVASSFLGSSAAWAGLCGPGSVAQYTSPTFSCTVGPLTFSHFTVASTTGGLGSVVFNGSTAFNPDTVTYDGRTEYGFSLAYSAAAAGNSSLGIGTADVALTYDVSGPRGSIIDAYMAFSGSVLPLPGQTAPVIASSTLSETLTSTGVPPLVLTMSLASPGATGTTFAGQSGFSAIKDQNDTAFVGESESSILVDAFSVTVPEPGTFALFGFALLGGTFWLRRRRA